MARTIEMGKVLTAITITNRADEIRLQDGNITTDQSRSIQLDYVWVNTGATTLCLPNVGLRARFAKSNPANIAIRGDGYLFDDLLMNPNGTNL
jgi:hypothetical protein